MLSRLFYLSGSVGTIATAPNDLVTAGGAFLTLSALSTFTKFRATGTAISAFAAAANMALIANGQLLTSSGLEHGDLLKAAAGTLLTGANVLYLYANIRALNGEPPIQHATASAGAGGSIAAAGACLGDPALAAIGVAFCADGLLRERAASSDSQSTTAPAPRVP